MKGLDLVTTFGLGNGPEKLTGVVAFPTAFVLVLVDGSAVAGMAVSALGLGFVLVVGIKVTDRECQ
jgi:hypothetical protein